MEVLDTDHAQPLLGDQVVPGRGGVHAVDDQFGGVPFLGSSREGIVQRHEERVVLVSQQADDAHLLLEVRKHPHRSEEHTSELQSLMRISYAVFCLKKKKKQHRNNQTNKNQKNNYNNRLNTYTKRRQHLCNQQQQQTTIRFNNQSYEHIILSTDNIR